MMKILSMNIFLEEGIVYGIAGGLGSNDEARLG